MSQVPLLSLSNLTFSYTDETVIHGINLSINQDEFVGIIGPNGAGKSTLIRLISGLQKKYQGTINLSGQNLDDYTPGSLARQIAYVPQNIALNFSFTVKEVVRMGRFPHQHNLLGEDPNAHQAIDQALEDMDLHKLQNRPFTQLSGGEKQRTIIASALAQESEILLLDEPTTALDLRHQQMILTRLQKLNKTILLVTHDINLAAQFCKRIILLDQGSTLADGTPEDVLSFKLLQKVYGVKVYIDVNPFTKSIYILPYEAD